MFPELCWLRSRKHSPFKNFLSAELLTGILPVVLGKSGIHAKPWQNIPVHNKPCCNNYQEYPPFTHLFLLSFLAPHTISHAFLYILTVNCTCKHAFEEGPVDSKHEDTYWNFSFLTSAVPRYAQRESLQNTGLKFRHGLFRMKEPFQIWLQRLQPLRNYVS